MVIQKAKRAEHDKLILNSYKKLELHGIKKGKVTPLQARCDPEGG
jgi:hypothetical protein